METFNFYKKTFQQNANRSLDDSTDHIVNKFEDFWEIRVGGVPVWCGVIWTRARGKGGPLQLDMFRQVQVILKMLKQPLSLNLNLLYRFVNQINKFRKKFLKIVLLSSHSYWTPVCNLFYILVKSDFCLLNCLKLVLWPSENKNIFILNLHFFFFMQLERYRLLD